MVCHERSAFVQVGGFLFAAVREIFEYCAALVMGDGRCAFLVKTSYIPEAKLVL